MPPLHVLAAAALLLAYRSVHTAAQSAVSVGTAPVYSHEWAEEDFLWENTTATIIPEDTGLQRKYWDAYEAALGNLTASPGTTELSRHQHTFLSKVLLCPPYSVSSKQIRCICQLGYGCTGSSHCQRGLSNRANRLRIEGWMIKKCTLCRCDPLDCKVHRKRCGTRLLFLPRVF